MPDLATNQPGNRAIAFSMQSQEAENWCWVANTASIANCYAGEPLWSQCSVASRMFNRQCCPGSHHRECDEDSYLDEALAKTRNLAGDEQTGPLSPEQIKEQIDQRRLIGARIRWASGFGHFITIHGYKINGAGQFFVYVKDPQRPDSLPFYRELVSRYQGAEGARWSHTYLTRPASEVNPLGFTVHEENLSLKIDKLGGTTRARKIENKAHFKTIPNRVMMPHDIYIMPFTGLASEDSPQAVKTGHRLIDSSEKNNLLIFDFSNEKSTAELQQVVNDSAYVNRYEALIHGNRHSGFRLRLLRVPELTAEALWFHSEEKPEDDYVIVISKLLDVPEQQRLPYAVFVEKLHKAAVAKGTYQDKRYK